MSNIYDMKLHELTILNRGSENVIIFIVRVPGGWIYSVETPVGAKPVFVPYHKPNEKNYRLDGATKQLEAAE